jgi:hypothetical protein
VTRAADFWRKVSGPMAVVHYCALCPTFRVTVRRCQGGRGYGFREGNKARGAVIRHVKAAHADKLTGGTKP